MHDNADSTWAQNEALRLFSLFGSWEKVAVELSPHLALSRASWWYCAHGQYITPAKAAALHAYLSAPAPPARVPRKRPERKSLSVRRETWERLHLLRRDMAVIDGAEVSWDLMFDRMLLAMYG